MSLKRNSMCSIRDSNSDTKLNLNENKQFITQNDLTSDDWGRNNSQHSSLQIISLNETNKINAPPLTYKPSFIIGVPIIKHHKQQNLQRTTLKNNNDEKPEHTMIEIEENISNELLERDSLRHTDTIDDKGWSCWLKFDLVFCWGIVILAGLLIGGVMILERFEFNTK